MFISLSSLLRHLTTVRMYKRRYKLEATDEKMTSFRKFFRASDDVTLPARYFLNTSYYYFDRPTKIYKKFFGEFDGAEFSVTISGNGYNLELTLSNAGSQDIRISRSGWVGFPKLDKVDFVLKPNISVSQSILAKNFHQSRGRLEYFDDLEGLFLVYNCPIL